ncbi:hypothetical protein [Spiroplasma endosymbiont of Melieria omissa]|uniref:hypothetical protein n=1 Tax=Spiroplasma endosymbiont of Melieria omissa TaxID=3139324 RepID=UPI003CCB4071
MNDIIKIANEIANSTNNATNFTNIQNATTWKSPTQEQEDKINEIHQQFLQAQEWGNKLNQEVETNKHKHRNRAKRGIPTENIINYQMFVFDSSRLLFAFSKDLWNRISKIYYENEDSRATFVQKVNTMIYEREVWQDPRANNNDSHRVLFEVIWNKFDELNSQITSSSKPYFRVTTSHTKNYYRFTEMDTPGEREEGFFKGGIGADICNGVKTIVSVDSKLRTKIQGSTIEVLENGEPVTGIKKGEGKIIATLANEVKEVWDNYDGNKQGFLNKFC